MKCAPCLLIAAAIIAAPLAAHADDGPPYPHHNDGDDDEYYQRKDEREQTGWYAGQRGFAMQLMAGPAYRNLYGHTPLSPHEEIPWSAPQLVVGTGANGRLPIMPEVWEEAKTRGVEVIALPTSEACQLLRSIVEHPVNAVLHVTC